MYGTAGGKVLGGAFSYMLLLLEIWENGRFKYMIYTVPAVHGPQANGASWSSHMPIPNSVPPDSTILYLLEYLTVQHSTIHKVSRCLDAKIPPILHLTVLILGLRHPGTVQRQGVPS